MSEVTAERVEMFKVTPRWGRKNLRVVKVTCLRRGKTLYFPLNRVGKYASTSDFAATADEALDKRIREARDEMEGTDKFIKESAEECAALEALRV